MASRLLLSSLRRSGVRRSFLQRSFSSSSKSTEQALLAYPAAQVSALPNGLRVATEPSHGDTATVGVWIDTGSRYESKETNGVAHFLEHMFFKGTAKRTRQQLEMEVENMGGHLNAYTSREQTVFYAQVDKSKVPQAMDILAGFPLKFSCSQAGF